MTWTFALGGIIVESSFPFFVVSSQNPDLLAVATDDPRFEVRKRDARLFSRVHLDAPLFRPPLMRCNRKALPFFFFSNGKRFSFDHFDPGQTASPFHRLEEDLSL